MREMVYARHYFIIDYLRSHQVGRRLDQIHKAVAEEFETVERTTRRDLEALRHCGFPIAQEKSSGGTFYKYVGPAWSSPPISFDPVEALSLVLAKDALKAAGEEFFSGQVEGLLEKLGKFQPDKFQKSLKKLSQSVYCQTPAPALQSHYEIIISAIDKRRKLSIEYRNSRGEVTKGRLVAPVQLWISEAEPYLVAHCYKRREIRIFSLKRMQKVELTNEEFDEQFRFDAEQRAKDSKGVFHAKPEIVELEFDDMLLEYFTTHQIHSSQQMLKRNGTNVIRLRVGINETLIHELLGYGPRVTVTKPERLRDIVRQRLADSVARYSFPVLSQTPLPLEF